jgi:hypothetical protein
VHFTKGKIYATLLLTCRSRSQPHSSRGNAFGPSFSLHQTIARLHMLVGGRCLLSRSGWAKTGTRAESFCCTYTVSALKINHRYISSAQFVFVAYARQLSPLLSYISAATDNVDHTLTPGDFHIFRKCVVHIVPGELRTMYFYAVIWSVGHADIVLVATSLTLLDLWHGSWAQQQNSSLPALRTLQPIVNPTDNTTSTSTSCNSAALPAYSDNGSCESVSLNDECELVCVDSGGRVAGSGQEPYTM